MLNLGYGMGDEKRNERQGLHESGPEARAIFREKPGPVEGKVS